MKFKSKSIILVVSDLTILLVGWYFPNNLTSQRPKPIVYDYTTYRTTKQISI